MRFSLEIEFDGNPPFELPTNYRINIASMLKEGIKQNSPDLYAEYWGNGKSNIAKPFTFSVYIPNSRPVKKDSGNSLVFESPGIKLNISSCDPVFLIQIYNALINLKDYTPFKYPIKLGHYYLHRQREFHENLIKLKTLSPVVVRKITDKKGNGYLTYKDPEFGDSIYHEIKNLCSHYIDSNYSLDGNEVSVTPMDSCRIVKIYHYKEAFDATSGTFEVLAPKEVLNLIYDAGLGARRSQGFGMMEVAG